MICFKQCHFKIPSLVYNVKKAKLAAILEFLAYQNIQNINILTSNDSSDRITFIKFAIKVFIHMNIKKQQAYAYLTISDGGHFENGGKNPNSDLSPFPSDNNCSIDPNLQIDTEKETFTSI